MFAAEFIGPVNVLPVSPPWNKAACHSLALGFDFLRFIEVKRSWSDCFAGQRSSLWRLHRGRGKLCSIDQQFHCCTIKQTHNKTCKLMDFEKGNEECLVLSAISYPRLTLLQKKKDQCLLCLCVNDYQKSLNVQRQSTGNSSLFHGRFSQIK